MSSSETPEVNCTSSPLGGDTHVTDAMANVMLCDIVLELAGMSFPRMTAARKIARALDRAYEQMTLSQKQIARARIQELETRWGPMLPGASSTVHATDVSHEEIAPEQKIAQWLTRRKSPYRILRVLIRAANCIQENPQRLGSVMDRAYAKETDFVLTPVSYDQFKEWMIELKIGKPEKVGRSVLWKEGPWCGLFVGMGSEIEPLSEGSNPVGEQPSEDTPLYAAKKAVMVAEGSGMLKKVGACVDQIRKARRSAQRKAQRKSSKSWAQKQKAARAAKKKGLVSST